MPSKKYIIFEPLLLAVMLAAGMFIGHKINGGGQGSRTVLRTSGTNTVEEILRYVDSRYVDQVDREDLSEEAIEAMLGLLDPHSKYIRAEDLQLIEEDMNGLYFGVGMEVLIDKDSLVRVSYVTPGSPSDSAGIQAGDVVRKVDTLVVDLTEMEIDEVNQHIRGPRGSSVVIGVQKLDGTQENITLLRDEIPIPSVVASYMMNDSIGIIRVNRFSNQTYKEFMQALEALKGEGLDDLIIDVRGNPGGYLQETVKILSQFILTKDELLVYTEGEHSKRQDYKSNGRVFHEVDDIVVVIDESSASASEILAGSLQDLDRAVIVGRRSFGKGLVQEQYPLENGGAVRLTTARYFTPSGRLIQKNYDDPQEYDRDLGARFDNGELVDQEMIPIEDSTRHFTARGRVVYGGGGITPDIFVSRQNGFTNADWPHVRYYINTYLFSVISDLDGESMNQSQLDGLMVYLQDKWPLPDYNDPSRVKMIQQHINATLAQLRSGSKEAYFKEEHQNSNEILRAKSLIETGEVDQILMNLE